MPGNLRVVRVVRGYLYCRPWFYVLHVFLKSSGGYDRDMNRLLPATLAATVVAVTMLSAAPKFTSAWRSPDAASVSFAGKKVAAMVITQDDSLRISGEEALVRELTARGLQSVATYRIAPKEELKSADRAKGWFEKANVEGVVAMRPVSKDKRTTYNPGTWVNPYYSTLLGLLRLRLGQHVYPRGPSIRTPSWLSRPRSTVSLAINWCGQPSARPRTRRTCSASSRTS